MGETAVGGLLLAAGAGRRMGGPKALLRWEGRLLVERAAEVLAAGGATPVVVVLGADAERVRREAGLGKARMVVAADWQQGMGASLRAGLAALDPTLSAVVVGLVDQPLVTAATVERLLAAHRAGAGAAVASYGGQPRNPVLLGRQHWAAVAAAAAGDTGARGWLRANPRLVTAVACDDTGSPADLDTPADVEDLRSRHLPPGAART